MITRRVTEVCAIDGKVHRMAKRCQRSRRRARSTLGKRRAKLHQRRNTYCDDVECAPNRFFLSWDADLRRIMVAEAEIPM